MTQAKPAEWYDMVYSAAAAYRKPYYTSPYYPGWLVLAARIHRAGVESVIDLGCGPGQFACLMRDQGMKQYTGIDFSGICIKRARTVCPAYTFIQDDLTDSRYLKMLKYDAVVICEFLEHIDDDLTILANIPRGAWIYATVPDFMCKGHVRCFHDVGEVANRYGHFMDDFNILTARTGNRQRLFIFSGVRK